jgi:predicted HTH transcriptional regulator
MKKETRLSIQWFYDLLEKGECDFIDFKEQLEDKLSFGKSLKNFAPNYEEMARDVVAFANLKGGFIVVGIIDGSKELNASFTWDDKKLFGLIKQVQNRTQPSITLKPHKVKVNQTDLLILEIPFSNQLHRTSRGEYLIRNNDGNRSIEPHEMSTIQAEKGLIVYDAKVWKLYYKSTVNDNQGNPIPGWQDIDRTRDLYQRIKQIKPQSPYLKNSADEFTETLGLVKEEDQQKWPTTAGILFLGNQKALREIPYNQIKYIRYYEDGTYTPHEYSGNLIQVADECFAQLKSEIKLKEFHFGLFREYIEDYPEVVLRELLINAIAHRDYSRQQIIEIRKYPNYIEFESPGHFPQGIDESNYLRKTNPRNPAIMDVLREINYAEKAGSGFDKVFTALLSKGKRLPQPVQSEHSIVFRVEADVYAETIVELGLHYKKLTQKEIDLEKLLVLNSIYMGERLTFAELEKMPFVNTYQLRRILEELQELELIEATGKTSGMKYIIHKNMLETTEDKISYTKQKKQEKARQIEAILRYLDSVGEIDNREARKLLVLPDESASYISRLFAEMQEQNLIELAAEIRHNQRVYKRK